MNRFIQSVSNVVLGGFKAFLKYPASMLSALVLAVTATIRVQASGNLDTKLFDSLQIASVLGAFLGMALTAFAVRRKKWRVVSPLANLVAILAAAGAALLLYLPAGDIPTLMSLRVLAASAVSLILFLLILSRRGTTVDYGEMAFITLKSAAIAGIYTLVLLGGLNFIAFAVKSLIYTDMSSKVYSHVSIWSALLGYAFFLGYFPDFRVGVTDNRLAEAKRHPIFIEILLSYVVVPLMAAMTAVLLVWSARILILGTLPEFGQLTTIFSAYALVGIGLAILMDNYIQVTAVWFRRLFPAAAIVFLAFEAYAIVDRIRQTGLKTLEYNIILIGLYALVSAVVLMLRPVSLHRFTAWAAALLIIVAVLPAAGYADLPAWAQGVRLERVLYSNQMLADARIRPSSATVNDADRATITDAADFLRNAKDTRRPAWFDASYPANADFQTVFGFAPVWPDRTPIDNPVYQSVYLMLPAGSVSLTGYQYAVSLGQAGGIAPAEVKGTGGTYRIVPSGFSRSGIPSIEVLRDGQRVLYSDLTPWLQALGDRYSAGTNSKTSNPAAFTDLVFTATEGGVWIMAVFQNVMIDKSGTGTGPLTILYDLGVSAIYLGE